MGLFAYLAAVIAFTALACGHQGETVPPLWRWTVRAAHAPSQWLAAHRGASRALRVPIPAPEPQRASQAPSRPAWAQPEHEEAA
jgi:hypothetical protein